MQWQFLRLRASVLNFTCLTLPTSRLSLLSETSCSRGIKSLGSLGRHLNKHLDLSCIDGKVWWDWCACEQCRDCHQFILWPLLPSAGAIHCHQFLSILIDCPLLPVAIEYHQLPSIVHNHWVCLNRCHHVASIAIICYQLLKCLQDSSSKNLQCLRKNH